MKEQNESQTNKIKRIILSSTKISSLIIFLMGVAVICAFFNLVGLPPGINRAIKRELNELTPHQIYNLGHNPPRHLF